MEAVLVNVSTTPAAGNAVLTSLKNYIDDPNGLIKDLRAGNSAFANAQVSSSINTHADGDTSSSKSNHTLVIVVAVLGVVLGGAIVIVAVFVIRKRWLKRISKENSYNFDNPLSRQSDDKSLHDQL